jgi:hypothetical protein
LISGSIGDAGAFASRSRGLEGEVDIEAEDGEVGRERCSIFLSCFLLPPLSDVRGDDAQGKRGRVALRWYGTVRGVRTCGRISVAERSVWSVA